MAITLSRAVVPSNPTAEMLIGLLSAEDPDTNDALEYRLATGSGNDDNRYFRIVGNQLLTTTAIVSHLQTSYSIRVQAIDSGGLSTERTLRLTRQDDSDVGSGNRPWQNKVWSLDVNQNGTVEPRDALLLINELNAPTLLDASKRLPADRPVDAAIPFYDVNGDGHCTPMDVLAIVNYLNLQSQSRAALAAELEPSLEAAATLVANGRSIDAYLEDADLQGTDLRDTDVPMGPLPDLDLSLDAIAAEIANKRKRCYEFQDTFL